MPPLDVTCESAGPGLRTGGGASMAICMAGHSRLDDTHSAQFVWARYRRVMRWLMLTTVTLVIGAMVAAYRSNGQVPVDFYIMAAIVIGFVMLLMSAVMGLRFLSRGKRDNDALASPPGDDRSR